MREAPLHGGDGRDGPDMTAVPAVYRRAFAEEVRRTPDAGLWADWLPAWWLLGLLGFLEVVRCARAVRDR